MGIARDSTDSVTTSSDWPILQTQPWQKCCLLDAAFVIAPSNISGSIITLNFSDGQDLLFHFCSPLLVHSDLYFKTSQNYRSICSLVLNHSQPLLASSMPGHERGPSWQDGMVIKRKAENHSAGQHQHPPPSRLCPLIPLFVYYFPAHLLQSTTYTANDAAAAPSWDSRNGCCWFRSANDVSVQLFTANQNQSQTNPHSLARTQVSEDTRTTAAARYTH